jgi:hypothetical protein
VADELPAVTIDLKGERRKSSGYEEEIALGKPFQGFHVLLWSRYIHTWLELVKDYHDAYRLLFSTRHRWNKIVPLHAAKTHVVEKVHCTSATDGGEWSASRAGRFTSKGLPVPIKWAAVWAQNRSRRFGGNRNFLFVRETEPQFHGLPSGVREDRLGVCKIKKKYIYIYIKQAQSSH